MGTSWDTPGGVAILVEVKGMRLELLLVRSPAIVLVGIAAQPVVPSSGPLL